MTISRSHIIALAVSLVSMPLGRVHADETATVQRAADLAAPVRLIEADHPIAAPFVADVDGDGTSELLVGEYRKTAYSEAGFRIYHRLGEPKDLKFDAGSWLQAEGRDATVPAFCYTGSAPQIVDFNGDGIPDLVSEAMIGKQREAVLRVFPGQGKGRYGKPTDVTYVTAADSSVNQTCYNARAFVYDWDGDGDLDILAMLSGGIWVVRRSGDLDKNQFGAPEALSAEDKPLRGALGSLCMADWDGDGRDDLIVSDSQGCVRWHRSASERGEPKLAAGLTLVQLERSNSVHYLQSAPYPSPPGPSGPVRVCAADLTGDGRVDLIVGDWVNAIASRPDVTKEQVLALKAAQQRMTVARVALQELLLADPPTTADARVVHERQLEVRRAECSAIDREIQQLEYERFERHGSIWFFQRLAK